MCNLYSFGSPGGVMDAANKALGKKISLGASAGNLPEGYVGADSNGPIIRHAGDGLEIDILRWGFPPTSPKDKDGKWAPPITNIRNLESRWWQDVNREYLLRPEYRCLVPFASFSEPVPGKGRENAWFETTEAQGFFAGIWRAWSGDTRLVAVEGKSRRQRAAAELELYAFLTTEPNAVVEPIHPKAMPVILTDPDELAAWMAGGEASLRLQRPLPASELRHIPS
ncbi:SOS response-associated peptidase family protein [Hyphomonas sp.]|uniref:SOS response-associated peptidase family protein n=1 Tax=Hyphomonas sp. TaxID=87 RepID=UPI00391A29F1